MSKSFRIFLGLAVGVVLATSAAFPAFCSNVQYFQTDPALPYSDNLPFGYNSIVVDVRVSSTRIRRFYLPYNSAFMLYKPGTLYDVATFCVFIPQLLSAGGTPLTNRIYAQTVSNTYYFNTIEPIWLNNQIINDYLYYELKLGSDVTASNYLFESNYSSYRMDDDTWQSALKLYPSNSRQVVSRVNEAITSLNQEEQSRYRSEMTQESRNHGEDMTQRSQQHSEIMNAGSDDPTLDTNNNWMDDSLSKVNGWLDDLSNFEGQMQDNRQENAANMSSAGAVIGDFVSNLPAAVVAAMALVLVIVVVVKIVGR